ncbi:MAG: DUF2075 domain-containing protein [Muribaculum sp.]|nr:DUF2075 domain-containing protein [Muribaculum sp.]
MKAVNLYVLTRNTNQKLYSDYENILSGREEHSRVKESEFHSLKAFVKKLLDNNVCISMLDGFYYSFSIQQIGKEFDLLKISCGNIVLNIELKSQMVSEEEIAKQLLRNKYYLNHLASKIVLFTYIEATNVFYQLIGDKLQKCAINDVIGTLNEIENFETGDINRLFKVRDFLISPLNTPQKFIYDQYFLTLQQESIREEIIDCVINKKRYKLWGITGSAGTGKTLLLYDIAKKLSYYGKSCIIHSGMLCMGHYYINEHINNLDIVAAKSVTNELLSNYRFIFVDEAQRIYQTNLDVILASVQQNDMTCVFSYDYFQVLSHAEEDRNIPQILREQCNFQERKLTDKIRSNKEIASFVRNLINLEDKSRISYKYEDIDIVYADNEEEAHRIIDYFCQIKNYTFIGYTQSRYYGNSIDRFPGELNTHEVIGQEFDNVIIMMDNNFRYGMDGRLQGREHPNPDYIFHKLLYQGISRPREKLCILVIDNMPLFEKILSIKSKYIQ